MLYCSDAVLATTCRNDKRGLKERLKEMELSYEDTIRGFKLVHPYHCFTAFRLALRMLIFYIYQINQ